jgi:hypothetical protein
VTKPDFYEVTFERIGRHRDVEPMIFEDVTEPEELAALIYQRAGRFLMSRGYEVIVDLDEMTGSIMAGMRPAGSFTIIRHGS